MKQEDKLQTFRQEGFDIFHMKVCDESVNPEDCMTAKDFNERMAAPQGVYEKHLGGIDIEKREVYLAMVEDERTKTILEAMSFDELEGIQKVFIGDMNRNQRKQIDEYIDANGYGHMRKEYSTESKKTKDFLWIYSCNLYEVVQDIGYYFHRQGLLRYCIRDGYFKNGKCDGIYGTIEEFELLGEYLDKEYIRYAYGNEAWNRLWSYYQKNFIDNFEYGRSILYIKL
jgi:hypothetical protein